MAHIWQEGKRKTRLWVDVTVTPLQPQLVKEKDEVNEFHSACSHPGLTSGHRIQVQKYICILYGSVLIK